MDTRVHFGQICQSIEYFVCFHATIVTRRLTTRDIWVQFSSQSSLLDQWKGPWSNPGALLTASFFECIHLDPLRRPKLTSRAVESSQSDDWGALYSLLDLGLRILATQQ